jgi:site-specific DNA-methyltransferase (adenine-specific)
MEINKIYNENCLDTMKKMENDFIDLTVTSPPYDDLRTYTGYSFDFEGIAKELYRTTKPGGVVVWVVGDSIKNGSESLTSFKQAIFFKEQCGFNVHDTMIYQKAGPRFPEKIRYSQIFEYMFVLSKGKPSKTHIIMDRPNKWAGWTNWGNNAHRVKTGEMKAVKDAKRYKKYGSRFNVWPSESPLDEEDLIYYISSGLKYDPRLNISVYANGFGFGTKDKSAYQHAAIYPEKLVEDHIMTWSDEGDLVYDPFMGSGTTAKVSILLNRNYIGSEISPEYTAGALERIKDLEKDRGALLLDLYDASKKRLGEEDNFQKDVKKKAGDTTGKDKWQPNAPDKINNDCHDAPDEQPEVLEMQENIRKEILGTEEE